MKESYNDLTYAELETKYEDLRKQYLDLRFKMVMGHVNNPLEKRSLRRKISRINTIIHEFDLGIRKK